MKEKNIRKQVNERKWYKIKAGTPYTYVVGFSYLNLYYYGVRYAKGCHPNDLLKTYFTSSVLVNKLIEAGNKPDIVQIRNTFKSKARAIRAEHRALKVIKKAGKKNWININFSPILYNFKSYNSNNEIKNEMYKRNKAIIREYKKGKLSQTALGAKYGLSQVQISRILKGK